MSDRRVVRVTDQSRELKGALDYSAWLTRGGHNGASGVAYALGRVADLLQAGLSVTKETPEMRTLARRLDALSPRERVDVGRASRSCAELLAFAYWLEREARDGDLLTSSTSGVQVMLDFLRLGWGALGWHQ